MIRRPPGFQRTDTPFPSTSLFRSVCTPIDSQMNDGDLARFGTGTFTVFGQLQQRAYLVQREAQLPGPPHKAEPHEMAMTIEPVTAFAARRRSEEHTSELQSLMRISYAVFCLNNKNTTSTNSY